MRKNSTYSIALLIIIVYFNCTNTHAQVKDFRIWTQLSLEKKLNKHLSIEALGGIRLGQNASHVEVSYFETGFNYFISKNWESELHYRYSNKTEYTDEYQTRHRLQIKLAYKKKWFGFLKSATSIQYQKQYTNYFTEENGEYPANYLRGQIRLGYDLDKKYEPYISTELFYQIKYNKQEFNRVRYEFGVKYEFNKYNQLRLFYMLQREFNEPNPIHSYILGCSYKIKI